MAFSGGVFSRVYSWATDKVNSIKITASRMDTEMDGMATGLSTCVLKDGTQTITANIPMSTFKFTGLGAGSARTDSARIADVQDAVATYAGSSGGTANVQTLTPATAITAYAVGQRFSFKVGAGLTNTAAMTLNISAVGAGAVQKRQRALTGGELVAADIVEVVVSATTPVFQIVSDQSSGGDGTVSLPAIGFGADTDNGLYRIGANNVGMATAGAKVMDWKADGSILTPLNPACLARITSDVTDGTGDGTEVTLNFGTEITDRGGIISGTTITFPQTGLYRVSALARLGDIGAAHTRAYCTLVATSRTAFLSDAIPVGVAGLTGLMVGGTSIIDATAADTAVIKVAVAGSTKTVDIQSDVAYIGLSVEFIG